jgi:hypothetical protein
MLSHRELEEILKWIANTDDLCCSSSSGSLTFANHQAQTTINAQAKKEQSLDLQKILSDLMAEEDLIVRVSRPDEKYIGGRKENTSV